MTGTLRIYLGAAPGVGKTMAMLAEGARRRGRGTDVVVAWCETHGRERTASALLGHEVVPRARRIHRGAELEDMDLDAVLARRPDVALVDELAHTNVPGGRHEKRWQDVQELLDAGIDVISTVNIQHLESLNDVTRTITGVVQRETVPDAVVRAADQIELVDMSPEALRRRMAHGNVYRPERVDAALANYFRPGNLAALRELALLWLADRVDEGLTDYRNDHGIARTWPTRTRVVVALSGGPEAETLLRRSARITSSGAGGELHAVYVVADDGLVSSGVAAIARLRRLTEELGGRFHTVNDLEPARAVLEFARGINASQIVIGMSRRPRWKAALRPGTGEAIIDGSGEEIDVHVVTHELAHVGSSRPRRETAGLPVRRVILGFVLAIFAPATLTGVLESMPGHHLGTQLTVQLYLLVTVLVAVVGGMLPAVTAGVVSSLLINWFFTPPLGTFTISDPQNAVALALFVGVAAVVSLVVHRSALRAQAALASGREAAALADLSHTMLATRDQLALLLDRARETFGQDAVALVERDRRAAGGARHVLANTPGYNDVVAREMSLADDGSAAPVVTVEEVDADHDLVFVGGGMPPDQRRLLGAYAAHAAAVLHRTRLERQAAEADALARDNRARTALLSAVSHDLRTPLAGIKAAVGSLRSAEVDFSESDREELLEVVEDSTDRLDALIGNLLDMSRLQTGALVARMQPVDLGDLGAPITAGLSDPGRLIWALDEDARVVEADPGLLERVLGNLVENADRYAPGDAPVRVTSSRFEDRVEVRVIDSGPGIAPEAREEIFRPFQRHGDAPAGDGVGLGLAVARGLAEAMGGTVEAEETPGGGVTMVVTLAAPAAEKGAP